MGREDPKVVRLELAPEDALLVADALAVFEFDVGERLDIFEDYDDDETKRMLERGDRASVLTRVVLEAYSETILNG